MQIAAALKTTSAAALAWTRLDITRPTPPANVTIAAIIGKNIAFIDPVNFLSVSTHLRSYLLILVNKRGSHARRSGASPRIALAVASCGSEAFFVFLRKFRKFTKRLNGLVNLVVGVAGLALCHRH